MSPIPALAASPARSVWPDLAAFAAGLGLAAFGGWDTGGLVWSLWLASLCVGYALIVTSIVRLFLPSAPALASPPPPGWENLPLHRGFTPVAVLVGLFLLVFFTLHFGGFHYGHAVFLRAFFPLEVVGAPRSSMPDAAHFLAVLREAWWFVPLALVAEREAFRSAPLPAAPKPGQRPTHPLESGMLAPYKNVVRLHLLIFFFAAVHLAGLPDLLSYLAVYTVYFFPWRVLRRDKA
jgi:hypothetical protein